MPLDEYVTSALALCVATLILYLWRKNSNLPPGPWGLPFLGHFTFLTDKPFEHFSQLAKRYGDVFSFRTVGGKLFVVLNGYKTAKEVLVNRADEFDGRPFENNLVAWVSDGLGIAQEEGEPWKEQRRFFLQSVKNYGFGKMEMEGKIQDEIKMLIDDLRETGGKPTDLHLHLAHSTNSIISHILFSRRFDKKNPEFQKMVRGLDVMVRIFGGRNSFTVGVFFDYIVMWLFPGSHQSRVGKKILTKFTDEIVDDHIRSFDPDHPKDFVDAYLLQRQKLKKTGNEATFTIPRLRAIALNMFFEGTESVAAGIGGFLGELSKHQEVQKRAYEEIEAVVGRERMPSWLDKPKLPYVDAVILELYRTAMPFNTSTFYSNFEETSIQGYKIPKRSILVANLWSLNNDPELFKNPLKFDPGRFLGPDGKRIKQEGPFTFGIGKRSCIGESLGQIEVFLFVSTIIQNFTLYPANEDATLVKLIPRE